MQESYRASLEDITGGMFELIMKQDEVPFWEGFFARDIPIQGTGEAGYVYVELTFDEAGKYFEQRTL